MLAVESLRAPAAAPAVATGGRPGEDTLVLRLGRVPEPGEALPEGVPVAAAPEAAAADPGEASTAAMDPQQYYVVRTGDTLSSIAREQLGSALLANELRRLATIETTEASGESLTFGFSVDFRQVPRLKAWAGATGLSLGRG